MSQEDNCCGCGGANPCASCQNLTGSTIIGQWTPKGSAYEEHAFTSDAGRYMLAYCGGAFGYTARLEPILGFSAYYSVWNTLLLEYGAHQWLDPQWIVPYGVIGLSYGKPGHIDQNFGNAPQPPGGGPYLGLHWLADNPPLSGIPIAGGNLPPNPQGQYLGQGNAADSAGSTQAASRLSAAMPVSINACKLYGMFYSDGSFPVTTQFTAPKYTGDMWPVNPGDPAGPTFMIKVPSGGGPTFTLLKLTPMFTAKGSCGVYESAGNYVLRLSFSNDSDFTWSGNASIAALGMTINSGNGQAWTVQPHFTTHLDFQVSTANKAVTVTLTLSDAYGEIKTLTYDVTPTLLQITAASQGTSFIDPNKNRIQLSFGNSNGLCFDNLQASLVAPSGGIIGFFDSLTGAQINGPLGLGLGIQGCGVPASDFVFDIATSTNRPVSVVLTVNWLDNNQPSSQPASVINVPLVWT